MDAPIRFLDQKPIELNRRQLVKGLAAGYIVALSGCVQNPTLGRQQLLLVSEAQITQLSASAWNQIRKDKKRHNITYNNNTIHINNINQYK